MVKIDQYTKALVELIAFKMWLLVRRNPKIRVKIGLRFGKSVFDWVSKYFPTFPYSINSVEKVYYAKNGPSALCKTKKNARKSNCSEFSTECKRETPNKQIKTQTK